MQRNKAKLVSFDPQNDNTKDVPTSSPSPGIEVIDIKPLTTSSTTKTANTESDKLGASIKKPLSYVDYVVCAITGALGVHAVVAGNEHGPSTPFTFAAKCLIGAASLCVFRKLLHKLESDRHDRWFAKNWAVSVPRSPTSSSVTASNSGACLKNQHCVP